MATVLDASELLGAKELAGALVYPKGQSARDSTAPEEG